MRFFRKREIDEIDRERLHLAFPLSLSQDLDTVIKILPLEKEVLISTGETIKSNGSMIWGDNQEVYLNSELLKIPKRIGFNEPMSGETNLTDIQKSILNCIYLRHPNGYIRQKRVEQLIDSTHEFIIPYTLHLLGEYVLEIIEVLDRHVNVQMLDTYVKFISNNEKYWQQTESRVISYWNEYYRKQYPRLKDYVGMQIVERIKKHHEVVKNKTPYNPKAV